MITGFVFSLLHVDFGRLINIIFADDFLLKLDYCYDVVLYSLCRLWSRMVKCFIHRSAQLETGNSFIDNSIIDSTRILLERLNYGHISSLCRGKCFSVLLQTVRLEPSHSPAIPTWMLTTAHGFISVLCPGHSGGESLSAMKWSFHCCLSVNSCQTGSAERSQRDLESFSADCEQRVCSGSSESASVCNASLSAAVTVSHRPCSLLQTGPLPCSVEENCDRPTVLYDVKLLRKFVLLALRSLDIVATEEGCQREHISSVCCYHL